MIIVHRVLASFVFFLHSLFFFALLLLRVICIHSTGNKNLYNNYYSSLHGRESDKL